MVKKITLFFLMIIVLLTIRLIDFSIFFRLVQLDIKKTVGIKEDGFFYSFTGFSTYDKAKEELKRIRVKQKEQVVVVGYYDVLHPLVFLVWNNGESKPTSLLWMFTQNGIEKGYSEFYSYKFECYKIVHNINKRFLFGCILGLPFSTVSTQHFSREGSGIRMTFSDSMCFGLQFMKYLKRIYLFYFYFPIFLLIPLFFIIGRSILISFIYFFEMMLLFSFNVFAVAAPQWIFAVLGINTSGSIFKLFSLLVFSVFAFFIFVGIKNIKKNGFKDVEKKVILFFILLPLFFRF